MERCTIIPPLLRASLDYRDSIEWGPSTPISTEVSFCEGTSPSCKGIIARYTIRVPDVYASVFALLMNTEDSAAVEISDDKLTLLGPLVSSTDELSTPTRLPHTHSMDASHTPSTVPVGAAAGASEAMWFRPQGFFLAESERIIREGGGVDNGRPSTPSWFPRFDPQAVPIAEEEGAFHVVMPVPLPGVASRDAAGRGVSIEDFSGADPLVKEALGSGAEEIYACAVASSSGMLPAFTKMVRSGLCYTSVIQGAGRGKRGVLIDSFYAIDFAGNAMLNALVMKTTHDDTLQFVRLARWLQEELRGEPVDIHDKRAFAVALRLAQEVKRTRSGARDHFGADATVGCGACSLQ